MFDRPAKFLGITRWIFDPKIGKFVRATITRFGVNYFMSFLNLNGTRRAPSPTAFNDANRKGDSGNVRQRVNIFISHVRVTLQW